MSADRGHRIKTTLVRDGMLEEQRVHIGRTRRTLLRVTRAAGRALGLAPRTDPRESLAHAYWKHWYAHHFRQHGYHVHVEAPRITGRVDVLATRRRERIAIEVETGKSNIVHNVTADLRSGFDRVLVIATDLAALEKIEHVLGSAGLLIPQVSLVLKEQGASG